VPLYIGEVDADETIRGEKLTTPGEDSVFVSRKRKVQREKEGPVPPVKRGGTEKGEAGALFRPQLVSEQRGTPGILLHGKKGDRRGVLTRRGDIRNTHHRRWVRSR